MTARRTVTGHVTVSWRSWRGVALSGERSVRMTASVATATRRRPTAGTLGTPVIPAAPGTGTGSEHASNGRPVLRLHDALSAVVRVDRRGRVSVVERFQLDVLHVASAVVPVVVAVLALAAVVATPAVIAATAAEVAAVVDGTGSVRRRSSGAVPVVPAPGPRASARAHGRVVRRRRGPHATAAPHRRDGGHRQAGHGPVRGDHVTFKSDCSLGGLRTHRKTIRIRYTVPEAYYYDGQLRAVSL